jgi:hypothetical protein
VLLSLIITLGPSPALGFTVALVSRDRAQKDVACISRIRGVAKMFAKTLGLPDCGSISQSFRKAT